MDRRLREPDLFVFPAQTRGTGLPTRVGGLEGIPRAGRPGPLAHADAITDWDRGEWRRSLTGEDRSGAAPAEWSSRAQQDCAPKMRRTTGALTGRASDLPWLRHSPLGIASPLSLALPPRVHRLV